MFTNEIEKREDAMLVHIDKRYVHVTTDNILFVFTYMNTPTYKNYIYMYILNIYMYIYICICAPKVTAPSDGLKREVE